MKDRICNWIIVAAMLFMIGAGVREMLIHNGRLTTDLNADGHSITNLPDGFFPPSGVTSVNGQTGDVVVAEADLTPSTNYTDRAIGSFAATGTVFRSASYGTPTRWTDATGCVWEVTIDGASWIDGDKVLMQESDEFGTRWAWGGVDNLEYSNGTWSYGCGHRTASFVATAPSNATVLVMHDISTDPPLADITLVRIPLTNIVGRVALTNDLITTESDPTVPDWAKEAEKPSYTPAEIGAAPAAITNEMAEMRTENQLVYRLYQGSNVVAEVTNYNSTVHAPELRLMQLNASNEYVTVWAETNGLARTLAGARQYTDDATGAVVRAVAPRAWSKVTAGMGVDAPSNTTWLSTGRTVIAGGLEYEKHVTSGGAIWLLESNGMTADFNPQTNNVAFLDLSNADGTPIFRVEKTDSFLVGVHIDGVTVDGNALVCRVGVVASEHPYVRISTDLKTWSKEEDGIPSSLATVTWSGSAGNWTCRIANNTGGTPFFANMEYMQEGGTKIVNSAPLDVSNGILCTDGVHKARPVYSNGTIVWEPVQ